jgi:hypothetical protein
MSGKLAKSLGIQEADVNEMDKSPEANPYSGQGHNKSDDHAGKPQHTAKIMAAKQAVKAARKTLDKAFRGDVEENFIGMSPQAVAEEQLDELSPELLSRAADKAGKVSKDLEDKSWAETPFKSGIVYSFEYDYPSHNGLEIMTMSTPWDVTSNIAYGRKLFNNTEITAQYPSGETKTGTIKDFPDLVTAIKHFEGFQAYDSKSTKFSTASSNAASRDQAKSSVSDMGISPAMKRKLGIEEDLDANQKRVGQLGPTEKVKNNNIGKLVGANESTEIDPELARIIEMARFKR